MVEPPGTRFTDVRWLAATGSTNDDVLALARAGAPEGIVVVADHQTAGRGRKGRTWQAPPGASLLMTVLLRPPAAVADLATMVCAVSLAEAVEDVTGIAPRLKWPNDLVVGDRKLCGILAEADWQRDGAVAVVVGIGLNVSWPTPLPNGIAETMTALNLLGATTTREEVLGAFLTRLEARYGPLVAGADRAPVLDAWRARSATIGRHVRVELPDRTVDGTATGVTAEGHLIVDTGAGTETFAAGDVIHVR